MCDTCAACVRYVHGAKSDTCVACVRYTYRRLALIALDIKWYGEWFPSKANVADIMTRETRFHELENGISATFGRDAFLTMTSVELELPPLGESWCNLKTWVYDMRAKRTGC